MAKSLKSAATKGMLWSVADKFAVQGGQLIIGIILARLLTPEDFGLVGMLSIFLAISQSFVDSGMEKGLVQKKNRTAVDFSTVFIFNFFVSLFFYALLYFTAPLVADFYDKPQLIPLVRVLALIIVVDSLAIVQRAKLTIAIDFKTFAKVRTVSIFFGGGIGIYMAYQGYAVWSLVIQMLATTTVSVLLLWYWNWWNISLVFSIKSFKELFNYGYKLLLSGLYSQTLMNIYNIAIGKVYSAATLGYYTNAKKYAEVAAATVTSVLQQVTFPILASIQDDTKRLISIYSRLVRMTTFIIFPTMVMLALLADPFIRIVLTEKWLPVVPLLQWMCFVTIFYPVSMINLNILNAVGRSDLFLKVNLAKSPFLIGALFITIPLGVEAIVIGQVVTSFISFFINTYYPGKLFGYGPISHIKDMVPFVIITIVMAVVVYSSSLMIDNIYLKFVAGGLLGSFSYLLAAYLMRLKEVEELKLLVSKFIK